MGHVVAKAFLCPLHADQVGLPFLVPTPHGVDENQNLAGGLNYPLVVYAQEKVLNLLVHDVLMFLQS